MFTLKPSDLSILSEINELSHRYGDISGAYLFKLGETFQWMPLKDYQRRIIRLVDNKYIDIKGNLAFLTPLGTRAVGGVLTRSDVVGVETEAEQA